jgi:hypothetical protein
MNVIHSIPMPKPIKAPAPPKIASVHIAKVGNGFKVQHNMTGGPHPKPFVFQNPNLAMTHLKKIQGSEWREPDRSEGSAVTKSLNLNTSTE